MQADKHSEAWTILREMQQQTLRDVQNLDEFVAVHIQSFQQQWQSDTTLCPLGSIRSASASGKHLLSMQMIQSSLL